MQNFKQHLKFGEALGKVAELAELARAFVHYPENWEMYEDLKKSDSAAVPPEFLLLCEAIEDLYGPPSGDDDAAAQDAEKCPHCSHGPHLPGGCLETVDYGRCECRIMPRAEAASSGPAKEIQSGWWICEIARSAEPRAQRGDLIALYGKGGKWYWDAVTLRRFKGWVEPKRMLNAAE